MLHQTLVKVASYKAYASGVHFLKIVTSFEDLGTSSKYSKWSGKEKIKNRKQAPIVNELLTNGSDY